jgi:acyl carrier protein
MNVEEIEALICESLRVLTGVAPEELARDTTFDAMGLDSVSRVGLVTQLGKSVGRNFDPEIAYEHGTPHRLAAYIADLLGGVSNP